MTLRRDPHRWSLATRLTLFLSLAMGAILIAVGWVMNDQLEHQLHEKDEVELSHTIATQRDIVRMMQAEPGRDGWARIWVDHMQPKFDVTVRILDPQGRVFTQAPGMTVPASAFVPPSGHRRYFPWKPVLHDDTNYLLTIDHVEIAPGSVWTIQAAENLTERHELLERFRNRLQIVVLSALLVALAAAWLLVRRGLAPLRAMSLQIADVNVNRLDARIGEHRWPSDLQALAHSFDAMMIRLQSAFEQLSQFSSDLAHEFRSPITNLVAAASVMLTRERSTAEYQETLAIVVDEGERLSRMVTAMLFLARADNARQAMTIEPVLVGEEFARLTDAFEVVAEERGVTLAAHGEGTVMADAILLRRALTNLLSNALAHTPDGGHIELRAESDERGLSLSVRDTGDGIAEVHLPKLFDRFYRVDAARSSAESTGLGLAVVKSIAELHGANMRVRSVLGQGSEFTMHFAAPRRAGKATDAA
jgi:two-component system heavy metal sensor histidine kinase CusS